MYGAANENGEKSSDGEKNDQDQDNGDNESTTGTIPTSTTATTAATATGSGSVLENDIAAHMEKTAAAERVRHADLVRTHESTIEVLHAEMETLKSDYASLKQSERDIANDADEQIAALREEGVQRDEAFRRLRASLAAHEEHDADMRELAARGDGDGNGDGGGYGEGGGGGGDDDGDDYGGSIRQRAAMAVAETKAAKVETLSIAAALEELTRKHDSVVADYEARIRVAARSEEAALEAAQQSAASAKEMNTDTQKAVAAAVAEAQARSSREAAAAAAEVAAVAAVAAGAEAAATAAEAAKHLRALKKSHEQALRQAVATAHAEAESAAAEARKAAIAAATKAHSLSVDKIKRDAADALKRLKRDNSELQAGTELAIATLRAEHEGALGRAKSAAAKEAQRQAKGGAVDSMRGAEKGTQGLGGAEKELAAQREKNKAVEKELDAQRKVLRKGEKELAAAQRKGGKLETAEAATLRGKLEEKDALIIAQVRKFGTMEAELRTTQLKRLGVLLAALVVCLAVLLHPGARELVGLGCRDGRQ